MFLLFKVVEVRARRSISLLIFSPEVCWRGLRILIGAVGSANNQLQVCIARFLKSYNEVAVAKEGCGSIFPGS